MDTPIQTSGLANVINLSAFRSSPLARESTDTHDTPIEKSEEGVHHTKGAVISESFITFVAETKLPTDLGEFQVAAYRSRNGSEPIAIISGDIRTMVKSGIPIPLRVHDQCFTSEVFGSLKCDCREQLQFSKQYIKENGGIIIYLQQEGRGIGLANKIAAYALQERGLDTIDANLALGLPEEMRQYDQVSHILQHIFSQSRLSNVETDKSFVNGSYESPLEAEENESASTESTEESEELPKFLLMTNNPYKIECLSSLGLEIIGRIPIVVQGNTHSSFYLHTKANRMSHMIPPPNTKS